MQKRVAARRGSRSARLEVRRSFCRDSSARGTRECTRGRPPAPVLLGAAAGTSSASADAPTGCTRTTKLLAPPVSFAELKEAIVRTHRVYPGACAVQRQADKLRPFYVKQRPCPANTERGRKREARPVSETKLASPPTPARQLATSPVSHQLRSEAALIERRRALSRAELPAPMPADLLAARWLLSWR